MPKNVPQELDSQFKDAIDNYGSQIKTLKDWCTSVKMRPSYHCGGLNERGFISLQREVFQNSIDQVVMETSPATFVYFYYNEQTLETTVEDNGLGFPFEDIERIVTKPNTSKNYEKQPHFYSSGYNGAGLKITCCLSSKLIAESYRYDGTAVRLTTVEGYTVNKKGKPTGILLDNAADMAKAIVPSLDNTQKIKQMLLQVEFADEGTQKIALLGALSLYLDFINLFLYLLRIFGSRE